VLVKSPPRGVRGRSQNMGPDFWDRRRSLMRLDEAWDTAPASDSIAGPMDRRVCGGIADFLGWSRAACVLSSCSSLLRQPQETTFPSTLFHHPAPAGEGTVWTAPSPSFPHLLRSQADDAYAAASALPAPRRERRRMTPPHMEVTGAPDDTTGAGGALTRHPLGLVSVLF
jgi:hypothetical protein